MRKKSNEKLQNCRIFRIFAATKNNKFIHVNIISSRKTNYINILWKSVED